MEGKRAAAGDGRYAGAGTAMGREPKQGMEGKQEQGQPWAGSQIKGWKAGAGTAMGREPKQGTDGKQEQGNRGKCLRTGRTAARQ